MNKKSTLKYDDFYSMTEGLYGMVYFYKDLLDNIDANEDDKDAVYSDFLDATFDVIKVIQKLCGDKEPTENSDITSLIFDSDFSDSLEDMIFYTDHKGLDIYNTVAIDEKRTAYTKCFNQIVWEKMFGELVPDEKIGNIYTLDKDDEWHEVTPEEYYKEKENERID